ncbi:MAG: Uma2 family endonuclease [Bacteroidota bacterium]
MITDIRQLDLEGRYTYADYMTWQFDEMVELIRGKVFRMSPAPGTAHQWVAGQLHGILFQYLKGQSCTVFSAPFDVRLTQVDESVDGAAAITTVVQPDLCVVCNLSKLDRRGCQGAPDWVVEILLTSTSQKDLTEKLELYQNAGVREYWVVDPHSGTVIDFLPDEAGQYQARRGRPYVKGEVLAPYIFPDLEIPLADIFPDESLLE